MKLTGNTVGKSQGTYVEQVGNPGNTLGKSQETAGNSNWRKLPHPVQHAKLHNYSCATNDINYKIMT